MWTCPKCAAKVDAGFEVCWQCGTSFEGVEDPSFVTADESPAIEEPSVTTIGSDSEKLSASDLSSELVDCYSARDYLEARFLADCLNEEGIPAIPDTFDLHETLGSMNANPRIHVPSEHLPAARVWLEKYERNRAEAGDFKTVLED